ncbi:MAG: chorismate synthase [Massilimicrobiota timonensis]
MSANWGNNIELSIFGESHGPAIGIVIGGLPAGMKLDMDEIRWFMKRRAPGQNQMSTPRKEKDEFQIVSGIRDGVTTGAPLCAMIENTNTHSKDYSELKVNMRPGHSDYPAYIKYHGYNDVRGGGHFSGRLTAPIVLAGSIARQILLEKGIIIGAHMKQIHHVQDESFPVDIDDELLKQLSHQMYPTLDDQVFIKMREEIEKARMSQDSVGGIIECAIAHVPAGIGNPFFDSVESHLSPLLFSIPAVKSVSFGSESIHQMYGHEANDAYYYQGDRVKTKTNHNGGITGGITNGMPIVFQVGIKPTPSISQIQETINVQTHTNTQIQVKGRHDPSIVPRAVVVVESMAALGILDLLG